MHQMLALMGCHRDNDLLPMEEYMEEPVAEREAHHVDITTGSQTTKSRRTRGCVAIKVLHSSPGTALGPRHLARAHVPMRRLLGGGRRLLRECSGLRVLGFKSTICRL